MPLDQTNFIMTPQLVWARCENASQFALWSAIKMVAGDDETCILGTRDLAALAMLGVATVHRERQNLLRLGLLEGELRRDPGYPKAVWHLRVPDLWAANHVWREAHPSLRERIEYKRAHGGHAQQEPAPPGETLPAWPPRLGPERVRSVGERQCSVGERQCSVDERQCSVGERQCSVGERQCSVGEPKNIQVLNPIEKQKRSLDAAWKNALAELELQFPRQVYNAWIRPLRPDSWHEGPDGARAVLLCPNLYAQEWCRERMGPAIQRVLGGILERPELAIEYRLMDDGRTTDDE